MKKLNADQLQLKKSSGRLSPKVLVLFPSGDQSSLFFLQWGWNFRIFFLLGRPRFNLNNSITKKVPFPYSIIFYSYIRLRQCIPYKSLFNTSNKLSSLNRLLRKMIFRIKFQMHFLMSLLSHLYQETTALKLIYNRL